MSSEQPVTYGRPRTSRGRLRRSGQALVRVGALLLAISLAVVLVAGLTTRSLINNLQDNSAELLDGTVTVDLGAGAQRALYVTGGLVAPGEDLPTPVDDIVCTVAGPGGDVPVSHLSDQGRRVGLDNPLARFQVVGEFRASQAGEHTIECTGRGVVVAPEVSPADGALRVGGLMLGSMGTFAGATMLLIGAVLLLVVRHGIDDDEGDDGYGVGEGGEPPTEGAEEWWEDETRSSAALRDDAGDDDNDEDDDSDPRSQDGVDEDGSDDGLQERDGDDDYVELTEEELAALSDEEIAEMVASGALVFVDDEGGVTPDGSTVDEDAQGDTYR